MSLVSDMTWIIFIIYVISSSLGMVLLKYGGKENLFQLQSSNLALKVNYFFLLGVILFFVSFVLWVIILQKFKLTFISPVAYGLTFIVLSFFSYILLDERVTIYNVLGAAIIILGIVISYLGNNPSNSS